MEIRQKSYFVAFETNINAKVFFQQNITFKTDLEMNVAKLVCLCRMSLGELLYDPKQVSVLLLKLK